MTYLTEYKKNGYEFALVERCRDIAIFYGVKPESNSRNYEVIKIRDVAAGSRPNPGKPGELLHWEAHESPPGDNDLGTKGWTYPNLLQAQAKFNQLLQP